MATQDKDKTVGIYPSDYVSTEVKNSPEWLTEYAQAAYRSRMSNISDPDNHATRFINYRKWAEGTQDMEDFKTALKKANKATYTLAYNVSHPIPTIVNSLVGSLQNQDYRSTLESISPETRKAKEKARLALNAKRFAMRNADQLKQMGVDVKTMIKDSEVFETEEEIDLHIDTNFKDDITMSLQTIVDQTHEESKGKAVEEQLLRDLTVVDMAGVRVYRDPNNDVKYRFIDPARTFSSPVIKSDYSDAKHIWEERLITADDLAYEAQGSLTEDDIYKASLACRNSYGNMWNSKWNERYYPASSVTNGSRPWGRTMILVCDMEVRSMDRIGMKETDHKRSKTKRYKSADPYKDENADVITVVNLYQINYIPCVEKVYNSGMVSNMTRDEKDGVYSCDTPFRFIINAPNIYEMRNKGVVEKLIPDASGIILTKLQEQVMVAKMKPRSVSIDMYAVAAALNGLGNKSLKPKDLVQAYEEGNPLMYSSVVGGQVIANQAPVRELPESTLQALPGLQMLKQSYLQSMELATGVPLSTVGAIDKDALVGIQKQQTINRNNAVRYIDNAYKDILTRTTKMVAQMIQDNIAMDPKKAEQYANAVGQSAVDTIEVIKKIPLIQLGITVETAPDADELQALYNSLDRSLVAKTIKESDAMKVRRIAKRNVKLAERYMEVWEAKYVKEQRESQAMAMKAQSEFQTQGVLAIEQAKAQADMQRHMMKLEQMKVEAMLSIQEANADFENDAKLKAIQGQIDQAKIRLAVMLSTNPAGEGTNFEKVNLPKESGMRMMSVSR